MKNEGDVLFQTVVTSSGGYEAKVIQSVAKLRVFRRSAPGEKITEESECFLGNYADSWVCTKGSKG
jgi:hypothetical protein